MSTTGRGMHSVLRIFKGCRGRTGHHAMCGALPAAGPYLRLSRFQGGQCRSHGTFPLFGLQSSHLNICYYHQDLHRRPLRPGSRPRFCSDRHALLLIGACAQLGTATRLPVHPASPVLLTKNGPLGALDSLARLNEAAAPSYLFKSFAPIPKSDERFARQYRCGPPPEFPLASPRSGIVHHLSNPDRYALTRTLLRRSRSVGGATLRGIPPISFLAPYGFTGPLTRTHVRLLGPCFKTGRMGSPQADARSAQMLRHANYSPGLGRRRNPHRSTPRVDRRISSRRSTSDRGASPAPICFPPDNFKHSLTLFSKSFSSFPRVLFIFPSRYLFAIGLSPVFSLGRNLPPDWGCIPKQPDSPTAPRGATRSGHDGALTLSGAPFQGTWARSAAEDASLDYNSETPVKAPDSQAGLFPIRSPLLGESLLVSFPPLIDMLKLSGRALGRMASGATCVQKLDDSRDSAIHTKYRISLRSSSMREPRYPLPRVILFVFHKSKNFTSDYEIRMPPTVPVNHYSDPEGQQNRTEIL
ncbi:hypothetical protein ACB092_11G084500 [Castanea dentata]